MLQSNIPTDPDSPVDLLLVGPITKDVIDPDPASEYTLGGTVTFAATTALCLGRKPTIVSCVADDTDLSSLSPEINLHRLPSPFTTTFANVYFDDGRVQYCYAQSNTIYAADIPPNLRSPRLVLLGPLADEVAADVATIFADDTLVAAVPQGWMRRWDETGRVYSKPWTSEADVIPHLDALVLSEEDIDCDLSRLDRVFERVPLVVITEYRDGSTIYLQERADPDDERSLLVQKQIVKVPPRPANEVDPTGAGDIFATAFLLRLQETGDPVQSARFANVTASFGVESYGVSGIPDRETVLAYMAQHPFELDS